jgi:hypothetical protein
MDLYDPSMGTGTADASCRSVTRAGNRRSPKRRIQFSDVFAAAAATRTNPQQQVIGSVAWALELRGAAFAFNDRQKLPLADGEAYKEY